MLENENKSSNNKRKKKRSANQMAKKFARSHSHGYDLDSETYQYMVRVLELSKQDFPSDEERCNFANNVYEQTVGHEVEYARNQVGSRVLDNLMKFVSLESIERLINAFAPELRPMCSDRFSSHVLQRLMQTCTIRGNNAEGSISESDVKKYNELALKLCRYVINNFEEFIDDTYANHVLRTAFECLGGVASVANDEANKKKTTTISEKKLQVSPEFKELLAKSSERIRNWPRFVEFGRDEFTSGLVQSILNSLKNVDEDELETVTKKIIKVCFTKTEEESLSNVFDTQSSMRLLEVCLLTSNPKIHKKIYKCFFRGNLVKLASMDGANFSVQRLFDSCAVKEDFEAIFEELPDNYTEILAKNYSGVFSSLANACERLRTKQGPFLNSIVKTLLCEEPPSRQSEILMALATLRTFEDLEQIRKRSNQSIIVNLHGSMVVQAILKFNKPIRLINSIMSTNTEELVVLFSDPKGSRIVDAFIDSQFVGEKSRDKLLKKLENYWAKLATGVHGSRCLDKLWEKAQIKQRIFIMEELSAAGESLRATKSGSIVSSKLNVALFARSRKEWTESIDKPEKTKTLFADIIGKDNSKT